jgi:hypothetical protein
MRRDRLLRAGGFLQERQNRFHRHDAVAGVRNHTQLCTGDCPEHLDGVLRRTMSPSPTMIRVGALPSLADFHAQYSRSCRIELDAPHAKF